MVTDFAAVSSWLQRQQVNRLPGGKFGYNAEFAG
jgi:hypothetical protein